MEFDQFIEKIYNESEFTELKETIQKSQGVSDIG